MRSLPADTRCIVIMPNASMSPRMALRFLAGMCVVSFAIAGYWAAQGFWMVLPFAGLEMLCLAAGLAWALHHNRYREVLRIRDESIVVERGFGKPESQDVFPLHWIRLELTPPSRSGQAYRILLRCSDRCVEIGRVLTDAERLALAQRLRLWLRDAGKARIATG